MITVETRDGRVARAEAVRIHRDAISIKYFLLADGEWVHIIKGRGKGLPTFADFQWEDPDHPYGWSLPILLDTE